MGLGSLEDFSTHNSNEPGEVGRYVEAPGDIWSGAQQVPPPPPPMVHGPGHHPSPLWVGCGVPLPPVVWLWGFGVVGLGFA